MDIVQYENRVYSQNGEDGIIAELIRRGLTTNKVFVEISVGDGTECNCRLLREQGWTGLAVGTADWADNVWITVDNIIPLLNQHNIEKEFDLLSLDIDGNDFWVLEKILTQYVPGIIVLEYNALMGADASLVMPYEAHHVWQATNYFGASLQAYTKLMASYGYSLLGCESRGVNAFFLRADLAAKCLFLPAQYNAHPSEQRILQPLALPNPSGFRPHLQFNKDNQLNIARNRATLEARSKAAAFSLPQSDGSVLCRALDSFDMFVDPTDKSVAYWIISLGFWESWITIAISTLLKRGQTVVNVGANLGYYSLLSAVGIGPTGKVYAFEPQPNLVKLIQKSIEYNGLSNLTVIGKAVGDGSQSRATLSIPVGMLGGASIVQKERDTSLLVEEHEAMVSSRQEIEVDCIELDSISKELGKVDLIIIDAEGFEQKIWNGMKNLLNENPNIKVVLEFSPSWYENPAGFMQEILDQGFYAQEIGFDGGFKPISVDHACAGELTMILFSKISH